MKKELNSELNLIAFISLLSVLICSLLLTAIWVQIGSMNVKQAVGGQAAEKSQKEPTLWVNLVKSGDLVFKLEDAKVKRSLRQFRVKNRDGKINEVEVSEKLQLIKQKVPDLRTALVKPTAESLYEDIILLLDQFKEVGLVDLGVVPL
jgi:biopolymer transport protein TolR